MRDLEIKEDNKVHRYDNHHPIKNDIIERRPFIFTLNGELISYNKPDTATKDYWKHNT